jgi:hypothetical protein
MTSFQPRVMLKTPVPGPALFPAQMHDAHMRPPGAFGTHLHHDPGSAVSHLRHIRRSAPLERDHCFGGIA